MYNIAYFAYLYIVCIFDAEYECSQVWALLDTLQEANSARSKGHIRIFLLTIGHQKHPGVQRIACCPFSEEKLRMANSPDMALSFGLSAETPVRTLWAFGRLFPLCGRHSESAAVKHYCAGVLGEHSGSAVILKPWYSPWKERSSQWLWVSTTYVRANRRHGILCVQLWFNNVWCLCQPVMLKFVVTKRISQDIVIQLSRHKCSVKPTLFRIWKWTSKMEFSTEVFSPVARNSW